MPVIDINWNPPPKDLRIFAILQMVFFAFVATIVYRRTGSWTWVYVIAVASLAVGVVGIARPAGIRPVYVGWMAAVFPIGWIISHVVLAAIFYLLFMPIGWIMRLAGRDPMQRKWDPAAKSYWQPHVQPENKERYFRQY